MAAIAQHWKTGRIKLRDNQVRSVFPDKEFNPKYHPLQLPFQCARLHEMQAP